MSSAGETAILLGATGVTGKYLLKHLLASPKFNRVVEIGRRVTPSDQLRNTPGKDKLSQKIVDFEKLNEAGLARENADVVVIAMGTTRAIAGSAEEFVKVDSTYVVNAAKAAKSANPAQRLVYLSTTGASIDSRVLYFQTKGKTERALAELGYGDYIAFRPGHLAETNRDEPRWTETLPAPFFKLMSFFIAGWYIPVPTLAKGVAIAAETGSAKLPASAEAQKITTPDGVPPYHVIFAKGCLYMAN